MADQREEPSGPPPPPPPQKTTEKEKIEAAGITAATGLGCLGMATLPWSILVLVGLIILIAWVVSRILAS
jgi:hypothetical protein